MGDAYIGIPKAVRIGCYPFRIEVGEIEDHETAGTFGHMNPISQKIRLRPGMSAQKLANAFIHEVLHGIYWFMSAGHFSLSDAKAIQSCDCIEEEYVTKGANGLCSFWQDNPHAVIWWAGLLTIFVPDDMVAK